MDPEVLLIDDDERRQIETLHAELLAEYGQQLGEETVTERFQQIVGGFDDAPIRTFVPLLAQRSVRRALREASTQA